MKLNVLLALLSFCLCTSAFAELQPVESRVYRWADAPVKQGDLRESRRFLEGTAPHFEYLEIHATTQLVGAKPNPPKAGKDTEELILVKAGLVKFTIDGDSQVLGPGSAISLMPQQIHTIENVGDVPLTYYVIKYRARKPMNLERAKANGNSQMYNVLKLPLKASSRGAGRRYFDRATSMCERLEMHVTQLHRKGPSHEPHEHTETEIILVLSGKTEMIIGDQRYEATAGDFYFMDADLHHGVGNATDQPCSYFALKWK